MADGAAGPSASFALLALLHLAGAAGDGTIGDRIGCRDVALRSVAPLSARTGLQPVLAGDAGIADRRECAAGVSFIWQALCLCLYVKSTDVGGEFAGSGYCTDL